MAFSEKTNDLVNELIAVEYQNACNKFGERYNSLHEGYAVLLEEVEEVETEINKIKRDLQSVWLSVKRNDVEMFNFYTTRISEANIDCMQELAQIGAVLMKIQNTILGEVKE